MVKTELGEVEKGMSRYEGGPPSEAVLAEALTCHKNPSGLYDCEVRKEHDVSMDIKDISSIDVNTYNIECGIVEDFKSGLFRIDWCKWRFYLWLQVTGGGDKTVTVSRRPPEEEYGETMYHTPGG